MSKVNDKGIIIFAWTMIVFGAISLPSYFAVKPVEIYPLLPLSVSYSYMVFSFVMSLLGIVIGIGLLRKSEKARKAGVSVFLTWLAVEIPFFFVAYVNAKQRTSFNGPPALVYPMLIIETVFNIMFILYCLAFVYYATRDKVKNIFQMKDETPGSLVNTSTTEHAKGSPVNKPLGIKLICSCFVLAVLFSLLQAFLGSVTPITISSLDEKQKIEILKKDKYKELNIRTVEEFDDYWRKTSKRTGYKIGYVLFNIVICTLMAIGIWNFKNWARLATILISLMTATIFIRHPLPYSIPLLILIVSIVYLYSPSMNKLFARK